MKKILSLMLACVMSLHLCSCKNESESQKEENKRVLKQAEENAAEYIVEKYGFEADITDSEIIYDIKGWDFIIPHSEASTNAMIKMEHDGKELQLIISGNDQNTNGSDDYQYDEIKNAFCDIVKSGFEEECSVYYKNKNITLGAKETEDVFLNEYFDGNDLSSVLEKLDYCIIELCDADISDDKKFNAIEKLASYAVNASYFYVISYENKWTFDKHPVVSDLEKYGKFYTDSTGIKSFRKFVSDGTSEYHKIKE